MMLAAWAQGWAGLAGDRLGEAGRIAAARSILGLTDLTGSHGILPDRILHAPADPRIPDPLRAQGLVDGIYAFGSGTETLPAGVAPWRRPGPGIAWRKDLFGFDWLRHLEALKPADATDQARWLVNTWIHDCGSWHPLAWRADILATRLTAWFVHWRMILTGADLIWRSAFLRSTIRQANHLHRAAMLAPAGEAALQAAIGLALTGLCLPHGEKRTARGLALTEEALARQILPDGGHVSRNPEVLARVYLALWRLDDTLAAQRRERPEALRHALDRMAPMLRFFCHGDGVAAAFNGSRRLPAEDLSSILGGDETGAQPLQRARPSGFHRMERGRAVVIMDTGRPPGDNLTGAHAGCLAFELSSGAERIVVNCGACHDQGDAWRQALRATAAHSTVTVADTSSCRFMGTPVASRRGGRSIRLPSGDGRIIIGPSSVIVDRADHEEGSLIEATHDGYASSFGLLHCRRLYVDETGTDIRGEDQLSWAEPRRGERQKGGTRRRARDFAARFHLHPDVIPELTGSGEQVQLTLQSGERWRFQAAGATVSLEESAYLDEEGMVCQARQIVLRGSLGARGAVIKWALAGAALDTKAARAGAQDEELVVDAIGGDAIGGEAGGGEQRPASFRESGPGRFALAEQNDSVGERSLVGWDDEELPVWDA